MNRVAGPLKAGIKGLIPEHTQQWIRQRRLHRERRTQFKGQLRNEDVFLVGHPKSGNTWLAYMLAIALRNDEKGDVTLANVGDYAPTIHGADQRIGVFPQLPSPRVFRNEWPAFPELYPRTIYLVRDPRAALVSYYHHCVHDTQEHDWRIEDFVDEMLTHGCIRRLEPELVRWDRQVLGWLDRRKRQNVQLVRYEDLKADRAKVLGELLEFIGAPVRADALNVAVARGEFETMREQEKTHGAESYKGEKGSRGFFVRKGTVDGWREELPPSAIQMIEDAFRPAMQRMGYAPSIG